MFFQPPRTGPVEPLESVIRSAVKTITEAHLSELSDSEFRFASDDLRPAYMADELICQIRLSGYEVGERNIDVRDMWYAREDNGWEVAHRMVPQGDRLITSEIRIFPALRRSGVLSSWSQLAEDIPKGGIPSAVLRRVRSTAPLQGVTSAERDDIERQGLRRIVERVAGSPVPSVLARKRAEISLAYSIVHEIVGQRQCKIVSELRGESPRQVTQMVYAMRGSFLTLAPKEGAGGGHVTEAALVVLSATEQQEIRDEVEKHLEAFEKAAYRKWRTAQLAAERAIRENRAVPDTASPADVDLPDAAADGANQQLGCSAHGLRRPWHSCPSSVG